MWSTQVLIPSTPSGPLCSSRSDIPQSWSRVNPEGCGYDSKLNSNKKNSINQNKKLYDVWYIFLSGWVTKDGAQGLFLARCLGLTHGVNQTSNMYSSPFGCPYCTLINDASMALPFRSYKTAFSGDGILAPLSVLRPMEHYSLIGHFLYSKEHVSVKILTFSLPFFLVITSDTQRPPV